MREYTVPAVTEPPTGSLADPVWANASSHPDTAVFSRRGGTASEWQDVTAETGSFLARGNCETPRGRSKDLACLKRTQSSQCD